jgi:PAS domain S-box-containing protein
MTRADNAGATTLEFLSGGNTMGALMRAFDWSTTALGPAEAWPQSLKTSVSTCLNSRFAILIWWGKDLTKLYNDAYVPILGHKHPRALGAPGRQVWPEIWHIIGPMLEGVMERGEATWADNLLLELERDGYQEECYFTFSYSPIRDELGNVAGIFTPVQETTAQVVGERRLRTLRDLAEAARTANAQDTAEVCRAAARVIAANPHDIPCAAIYTFTADGNAELTATACVAGDSNAFPPAVRADSASQWIFGRALTAAAMETVWLSPGAADLPRGAWPVPPLEAVVIPISPSGQRVGFLIAAVSPRKRLDSDYTSFLSMVAGHVSTAIGEARALQEERRRADALAEIDRVKTAFFANVSHEFRTPLTLMLGPLEQVLAKDGMLPEEDRQHIAAAHRNSLRLLKLVNTLLDFSRIEAGRMRASYAPVDLASLTADLASNFRSTMEAAGLRLHVDCEPLPEPVYVDREMWEKIVLNLLSNAFKFTFEGAVRLRLAAGENHAILTVADTGVGIPEAELPHIFERFHRVENVRGRNFEGSGIGLALIEEFVKLHGGTVEVHSRVGEGSTFTVALPFGCGHIPREKLNPSAALDESAATWLEAFKNDAVSWLPEQRAASESRMDQPRGRRARILIADDNADMREYVARILAPAFQIVTVGDGNAAVEDVRRERPDLILADVMMPVLDGFGLVAKIRSDPRTVNIPIILLSARAGEESRMEGMDAGADDYLVKPFSARELVARVGAHLKLAQTRERVEQQARGILDSITDGFLALDRNWRLTEINAEGERLSQVRREDVIGRNHWDVFPAGVGTVVDAEYQRCMRDRVPVDFENFYAPWDTWFHIKAFPAPDGGLAAFYEDITQRKRAELMGEEQRKVLEMIARGCSMDECLSEITEGIGRLRPGVRACILRAEDDGGQLQHIFTAQLPSTFAAAMRGVPLGETLFRKEWKQLCLEHGIHACHATPISGESGFPIASLLLCFPETREPDDWERQIAEFNAYAAGITIARHRAAAALLDSESRFRQLADFMPHLVWTARPDGYIDYYNERWYDFTGCARDVLGNANWPPLIHPQDLQKTLDAYDKAIQSGQPFNIEYRLWDRYEKRWRWFIGKALPICDAQEQIVKWFGSATDIDEQKRVEDDLRRANQDLEQFAYSASHDLQEPLRSIKIYSELLSRRYGEQLDADAQKFISFLRSGATRMENLVRDLLTYTKVTRLDSAPDVSDANEALAVTLSTLANSIAESGAQVVSETMPKLPVAPMHLQQLFQNLIGNAIKYRHPERRPMVRIAAERRQGHWLFSVADNGIGINPEYKESIFGLFKRLHTDDQYSGTGIGLAICQRIVDRYDGRIWVESQPGEGSTFQFILPA